MLQKLLIILLIFTGNSFAQERLILIGGGKRTTDVLTKFIEWSGKEKGKILVIPWASGEQLNSFESIKKDILAVSAIELEMAPLSPLTTETKATLLNQLKTAY